MFTFWFAWWYHLKLSSPPRLSTRCCFSMLQLFQIASAHIVIKKMWWVKICVLFLPRFLIQWHTPKVKVVNIHSHLFFFPISKEKKKIHLSFHFALSCFSYQWYSWKMIFIISCEGSVQTFLLLSLCAFSMQQWKENPAY